MRFADVHGFGDAHLAGQIEAVFIDVGDDHVAGAGMARHGGGHDADGPGAGDQHIFAEHRERQRGVHGVAEGIEDGGDILVDAVVMPPDVGHGQRDVFGKSAGAIHADALRFRAQMAAAGQAIAAASADHMPFAADDFAGVEIGDVGADLGDLADEFVADHQAHGDGLLRPIVPLVDMHVGAANACAMHADQNVVDADAGLLDVFQPEAGFIPAFD